MNDESGGFLDPLLDRASREARTLGIRCDAWMPYNREHCARFAGHAPGRYGDHRSRYALDNNARGRSGKGLRELLEGRTMTPTATPSHARDGSRGLVPTVPPAA